MKDLLGDILEIMLQAELDDCLDYEYGGKPLDINNRNGSSKKTLKNSYGKIDIDIPRDRESSFEPRSVRKYQRDISSKE